MTRTCPLIIGFFTFEKQRKELNMRMTCVFLCLGDHAKKCIYKKKNPYVYVVIKDWTQEILKISVPKMKA